jgi:hypothetical protein
MSTQTFYLVGDAESTGRTVAAEPAWKLESLKKAVAQEFHIVQPQGILHRIDIKN